MMTPRNEARVETIIKGTAELVERLQRHSADVRRRTEAALQAIQSSRELLRRPEASQGNGFEAGR